jgi:hypothetical protein
LDGDDDDEVGQTEVGTRKLLLQIQKARQLTDAADTDSSNKRFKWKLSSPFGVLCAVLDAATTMTSGRLFQTERKSLLSKVKGGDSSPDIKERLNVLMEHAAARTLPPTAPTTPTEEDLNDLILPVPLLINIVDLIMALLFPDGISYLPLTQVK